MATRLSRSPFDLILDGSCFVAKIQGNNTADVTNQMAALNRPQTLKSPNSQSEFSPDPPFDVLDGSIYTSIALGKSDEDLITQYIARVLSSTQAREQVAEIAEKARNTVQQHEQETVEDILAETFSMFCLKDIKSWVVQMMGAKSAVKPNLPESATEAERVDDEVESAARTPIVVQQIMKVDKDTEEDTAAASILSTSLQRQRNDFVIETDDGPAASGILNKAPRLYHVDCDENIDPALLSLDLANANLGKKRLDERICVLEDEMACVIKELADEKRAHQGMRTDADRVARSWRMEVEGLRTQIEIIHTEKMDMKVRVEQVEASKDSLEEALATEETSHRTSRDAFHAGKKGLIAAHETEKAKMRNILTTNETAHEELEARVVSLKAAKVTMVTRIEELDADKENFEVLLAAEKDERRALQVRVDALQLDRKASAFTHASRARKVDDLRKSLTILHKDLKAKEAYAAAYRAAEFKEWQSRRATEMERDSLLDEYRKEFNARTEAEAELERVKGSASQRETHIQDLASRYDTKIQARASQQGTKIRELEAKNKKLSSILSNCRDSPFQAFIGMSFEKLSSIWSRWRVSPSRFLGVGIGIGLLLFIFLLS